MRRVDSSGEDGGAARWCREVNNATASQAQAFHTPLQSNIPWLPASRENRDHAKDKDTSSVSGAGENPLRTASTGTEEERFQDGARDVKAHAHELLRIFDAGKDARNYLATLPLVHPSLGDAQQGDAHESL